MKEKEQRLLIQLFHNQNRFVTSKELSNILSLSERTIRTYIHCLQEIVNENGAEIIAKQGFGYQLHMLHPMQFELFLNNYRIQSIGQQENKTNLESREERQRYILNKLLIEDEHVFLESIADSLYISRSTLTKEIHALRELLQPYSLCLVSKPRLGTWIAGDESKKRAFIMNYFFKGSRYNSIDEYMKPRNYFDDIPTESFIMIILDECRKNQIKLSDVMIQNVLMHLTLSIKRIEKGLELKRFLLTPSFTNSIEYKTAKNMIDRLESELNIYFPEEEIAYLTLHLGAKNNHPLDSDCIEVERIQEELDHAFTSMNDMGDILKEDTLLKKCLLEHLKPMLIRIHQGIKMENPLTEEIMTNHIDTFHFTKKYLCEMPSLSSYDISNDEWAYLTLHFMAAIERLQEKSKLQVLIICSTGCGSAQLLKSRVEKEFGKYIHVVSEMGYFEMCDKVLKGVDLIISSVNLDSVIFGIPFLHVSVFLSDNDVISIQKFIDEVSTKHKMIQVMDEDTRIEKKHKEVFDSYIHPEYFQVFQGITSVERVIETLLHTLSKQEKESYTKHMVDQIQLRESLGSIIFSDCIAIPHPAIPVGQVASIAIGIFPKGLKWNDDYPNIKIVFLLSPSCLGNQEIKIMTKTIIRFIDAPELQAKLLENPMFEEFKKIFLNLM